MQMDLIYIFCYLSINYNKLGMGTCVLNESFHLFYWQICVDSKSIDDYMGFYNWYLNQQKYSSFII